jgi:hypothetical protein
MLGFKALLLSREGCVAVTWEVAARAYVVLSFVSFDRVSEGLMSDVTGDRVSMVYGTCRSAALVRRETVLPGF